MRTIEEQKEVCRQLHASYRSHFVSGSQKDAKEEWERLFFSLEILEQMMLDEASAQFALFRRELQ